MSLYSIKKVSILPVLKIYSIILAIGAILFGIVYATILHVQYKSMLPLSEIIIISASIVLVYFVIAIITVIFSTWIYNLSSKHLGGIVIELEPKE